MAVGEFHFAHLAGMAMPGVLTRAVRTTGSAGGQERGQQEREEEGLQQAIEHGCISTPIPADKIAAGVVAFKYFSLRAHSEAPPELPTRRTRRYGQKPRFVGAR